MTASLPWPARPASRADDEQVAAPADWFRLARTARLLSWLTLAWMGIEGGVAIGAAIAAGSVALLGFGLDSGIDPEGQYFAPANVPQTRTAILNEIRAVLRAQGVRAANPAEVEELVRICTCYCPAMQPGR